MGTESAPVTASVGAERDLEGEMIVGMAMAIQKGTVIIDTMNRLTQMLERGMLNEFECKRRKNELQDMLRGIMGFDNEKLAN